MSAASPSKVLAVCGATGSQGGGVVKYLLENTSRDDIKIRGLTRDANSDKAKALTEKGVEMVSATFNDLDALKNAFNGVTSAYIVTNYWDPSVMNPHKELEQVKNIANACKENGVEYVVYSTFEDTRPFLESRPETDGGYKVAHFDAKNEGNKYMQEIGLNAVFLNTGFYFENVMGMMAPQKGDDGNLKWAAPTSTEDKPFPAVSVQDIGAVGARLLLEPGDNLNKDVGLSTDWITCKEIGEILSKATGLKVNGSGLDYDVFAQNAPFAGLELANMFWFYCEKREKMVPRSLEISRALYPQAKTFEQWATQNAETLKSAWKKQGLIA